MNAFLGLTPIPAIKIRILSLSSKKEVHTLRPLNDYKTVTILGNKINSLKKADRSSHNSSIIRNKFCFLFNLYA